MISSKKYLGLLIAGTLMTATGWAQDKPVETKGGTATVTISPSTPTPAPQAAPAPGTASQAHPATPAAAAPKEIKDPAEYSAYSNALNQPNPQSQASLLENFLQLYPNTVVKEDALTALLKAYQVAGDAAKMNDAAQRLLQINPSNITALALVAYGKRTAAETPNNPNAAQDAAKALQTGMQGLQALQTWPKPDPKMSDADFAKQKDQLAAIFYGAAGRGAVQANNLPDAAKYFKAAADLNPANLNDVYALAYAYLSMKPINPIGLWYAARAVNLSKPNPQASAGIDQWAHSKYLRFHSPDKSDDHWADVVAMAAQSPQPPPTLNITPAPTDREVANGMAGKIDATKVSIAELEYIFQYADPQVSQDVINKMKGQDLAFQTQVIQPAAEKLMVAATQDAITAGKADVEVTMVAPIPAKQLPKAGSQAIVIAQIAGFQANPFVIQMNEGKLGTKGGEPTKPKKRAAAKRPARRH